jgi:hypothetical protein
MKNALKNITITYYYHTQLLGIKILYKTKT